MKDQAMTTKINFSLLTDIVLQVQGPDLDWTSGHLVEIAGRILENRKQIPIEKGTPVLLEIWKGWGAEGEPAQEIALEVEGSTEEVHPAKGKRPARRRFVVSLGGTPETDLEPGKYVARVLVGPKDDPTAVSQHRVQIFDAKPRPELGKVTIATDQGPPAALQEIEEATTEADPADPEASAPGDDPEAGE